MGGLVMSAERTAVLLDQHPLWLDAVEQVLSRIGVDVVGKATTPEEAVALVESAQPEIFVSEIEMPAGHTDGLTTLRQVKEKAPGVRLVVLSTHSHPQHIDAALDAGVIAYVVKTAHPDDLASAIRQVFDHSIYLSGSRNRRLARRDAVEKAGLTKRELEILRLVSQGRTNTELARSLWVTEQTIKFHLSNVYRKLDVSNRTEASHWAQTNGLLTPVSVETVSAA